MYTVKSSFNPAFAVETTPTISTLVPTTAATTNFGSGNLVFTNQRNYMQYASVNYVNVKLVSGTKKDGTHGMLLEATNKSGAIEVLSISNKLTKAELKDRKAELVLSSVADDNGSTFQMVHLSGSKWESEDF